MDINDMRQKRAGLAKQARELMDAAQNANRSLTGEESEKFNRLMDDVDQLDADIARAERLREQDRKAAAGAPTVDDSQGQDGEESARAKAFRAYLVGGRNSLTVEQERALQVSSDPEGGYLVAPQQWVQQLLKNVDDAVPLRGLATTMTLTDGESLGVPSLDTDLADADWTTELGTGSQDDNMRIGKRELRPNPVAKRVKISRTLLRKASMDPEDLVRGRMEYKFGVTAEKAYMTGDGNKKPLGLFVASSQGISTNRDVLTGSATDFTGDGLIDAKYTLKAAYWKRARWLFHRDAIKRIRKLKTSDGQYLWMPGLAGGQPDSILEVPFVVSEWVPNTFTTGQYVGMIADFSFYWIVDSLALDIQRLTELYAETNQVGFIGRLESDAMPVLEEPFVRIKTS